MSDSNLSDETCEYSGIKKFNENPVISALKPEEVKQPNITDSPLQEDQEKPAENICRPTGSDSIIHTTASPINEEKENIDDSVMKKVTFDESNNTSTILDIENTFTENASDIDGGMHDASKVKELSVGFANKDATPQENPSATSPLLEEKCERLEEDEFEEIDAEIDDALDEGYMGMECTLERGFSLNDSSIKKDLQLDELSDFDYVPRRSPHRYSNALRHLIPVRRPCKNKQEMKVDSSGFWSFVTFNWITSMMWKSYRHGLKKDDIPLCSKFDLCHPNTQRLTAYWEEEVKEKGLGKATLHRPIWRFVKTRMIISILALYLSLIFGLVGPTFFMRYLIDWLSSEESVYVGVQWGLCLILCEAIRIIFFGIVWGLNYRTAIRLRAACLGLVYQKLMKVSSLGNKSIGEVINLFANDGQRIFDVVIYGTFILSTPLIALAGFFYVLFILGPWALLGMMSFLFFYPCMYAISRITGMLKRKTVTVTDQRVRKMTEIFTCIKLIKMYAWEKCFAKSIAEIRKLERKFLEKSAYVQSISVAMTPTVPVVSAAITFLAHISAGYNLTPAQ